VPSDPTGELSGALSSVQADSTQALVSLLAQVDRLLTSLSDAENSWASWLSAVSPEHRSSARISCIIGRFANSICANCKRN